LITVRVLTVVYEVVSKIFRACAAIYTETRVDGRTTRESVCQVARSWVEVASLHTCLFGVGCVTCSDIHDGSQKRPVSHSVLTQQFMGKY
jgi:hypothetical protein